MSGDELERTTPEVEVVERRPTVVTALPLKEPARRRLAELLDARVVDVREPVDDAHLVLTPPCSPQLIGKLGQRFTGARVVVVELSDWEHHIELPGPVKHILRSGAAAYVLADSLEELAAKITSHPTIDRDDTAPAAELPASATVDELIAAFLRESVEYATRANPPTTRE